MIKKIKNVEVVGELDVWSVCEGFLHLNWQGNVDKVLFKKPRDLSWYECIDKGGIPLYGFDGNGNVICACALVRKGSAPHISVNGQTYENDVIYVMKANKTDDYGWGVDI